MIQPNASPIYVVRVDQHLFLWRPGSPVAYPIYPRDISALITQLEDAQHFFQSSDLDDFISRDEPGAP